MLAWQESVIHHWAFDGNAIDSVGGKDLTEFGQPTYVPGRFGEAVSLVAPGDFLFTDDLIVGNRSSRSAGANPSKSLSESKSGSIPWAAGHSTW